MTWIVILIVAATVLVALFFIPWVDREDKQEHDRRHRQWQEFVDGGRSDSRGGK